MNNLPSSSGVYCLWNKITNQIYVGSTTNLSARIKTHFSPKCHNSYLKRSIKKYGKENFSITWFETDDFIAEEQNLLDYIFENNIPTFNVAVKAGGNPGGSIEGQRLLCLKGKSKEELRLLSEAGGGPKAVPLFLIDTETKALTRIESGCEGERLGLGLGRHLSSYSKPNCLNRVKTYLVARAEAEVKSKLEAWLLIPGNNPIVLELPVGVKQSALYKLANVHHGHFSQMWNQVPNPSSGKPLISAMQSKKDFNWYGTEIKAGDWFRCTKTNLYK